MKAGLFFSSLLSLFLLCNLPTTLEAHEASEANDSLVSGTVETLPGADRWDARPTDDTDVDSEAYARTADVLDERLPVRGISLSAPQPDEVDEFIEFIHDALVPRHVNKLVFRIGYRYEYESHPELRADDPLSREDIERILEVTDEAGIELIPLLNLYAHQSWAGDLRPLLEEYPEFDETPGVEMPEEYEWPNEDGLYTKAYCPLHPEVHNVVFALVDELIDVFRAETFHAGMDEVFYVAHDDCPRCAGWDPARLYAKEVTRVRNHLADQDVEMWMWSDRFLDGRETGLGMWEASMNNTARAIDMIPKDVVMNAWHYTTATPTQAHFAMKGFNVIACPWRVPEVGVQHFQMNQLMRDSSTEEVRDRLLGVMQTVWTSTGNFMDKYYGRAEVEDEQGRSQVETFRVMYDEILSSAEEWTATRD